MRSPGSQRGRSHDKGREEGCEASTQRPAAGRGPGQRIGGLLATGETFVLWDGNGLVVKQVETVHGDAAGEDEPPRLRLISANPDYAPYTCLAEDVHILGKVLWVIRRV